MDEKSLLFWALWICWINLFCNSLNSHSFLFHRYFLTFLLLLCDLFTAFFFSFAGTRRLSIFYLLITREISTALSGSNWAFFSSSLFQRLVVAYTNKNFNRATKNFQFTNTVINFSFLFFLSRIEHSFFSEQLQLYWQLINSQLFYFALTFLQGNTNQIKLREHWSHPIEMSKSLE